MTQTRAERLKDEIEEYGRNIAQGCTATAWIHMVNALCILADASLDGDRLRIAAEETLGPFLTGPTEDPLARVEHGILEQCKALAEVEKELATIRGSLDYPADAKSETILRRIRYLSAVERCVLEQSHAVGINHMTADASTRVAAMRMEIERLRKPREE